MVLILSEKQKTMETEKIYNLIILDESGSMQSIKKSTINGFNEVIQTIREVEKQFPEQQHFVSFVTFSGLNIRTHMDKAAVRNIREIDDRTYLPNSSTPLYDAMGISLMKLKYDLAGQKDSKVLVTIITDGEENASHEFSSAQIRGMVEELKQLGWTFTYIGANQDVVNVAMTLSITNTMQFSADETGVGEMFTKEKNARYNYSNKIRNKMDPTIGFYDEEPTKP
jgi:uncharacterized protein YegL